MQEKKHLQRRRKSLAPVLLSHSPQRMSAEQEQMGFEGAHGGYKKKLWITTNSTARVDKRRRQKSFFPSAIASAVKRRATQNAVKRDERDFIKDNRQSSPLFPRVKMKLNFRSCCSPTEGNLIKRKDRRRKKNFFFLRSRRSRQKSFFVKKMRKRCKD